MRDARFTFSRSTDLAGITDEDCAAHGEADGEGGSSPRVIPERLTLRPMKRLDQWAPTERPTVEKGEDESKPNK